MDKGEGKRPGDKWKKSELGPDLDETGSIEIVEQRQVGDKCAKIGWNRVRLSGRQQVLAWADKLWTQNNAVITSQRGSQMSRVFLEGYTPTRNAYTRPTQHGFTCDSCCTKKITVSSSFGTLHWTKTISSFQKKKDIRSNLPISSLKKEIRSPEERPWNLATRSMAYVPKTLWVRSGDTVSDAQRSRDHKNSNKHQQCPKVSKNISRKKLKQWPEKT